MLFGVLAEERLIVEGGFPLQDMGCATGVGRANGWVSVEKGVLSRRQADPEVAVLAPAEGNIDRCQVRGDETIRVSDGAVARFPQLLGEGWGHEVVGNGVDRLGVRHILFFSLVADCSGDRP